MAMVSADWTITRSSGDVRYIGDDHGGGAPSYATVIQFHRWLQDFADNASSSGDDELDITDDTPSDRSTDNIITLLGTYNIDDNAAEHLYDGSIIQGTGGTEEYYDGIVNFGNASVQIQIHQNGAVLADDWWNEGGAGLNADANAGISHRFMLKVRTAGADINGRRLLGVCRTYGNTYAEFSINGTSRGNNVLALSDTTDLNNGTAIGTVAGYTGITNTSEGYVGIDVNNDTTDEFYYSEWNANTPTRSINDFYERLKWLSKDPVAEDSNADTGSDFTVGNGTLTGQGQSFTMGSNNMLVTKCVFNLKVTGSPTGNATANLYAHTGTFGSTGTPTGGSLDASATVDVTTLDTTYRPVTFSFDTPVELTASTNYFVTIEYSGGDGSNYVQVQGLATSGTHGGNRAETNGAWSAAATDDLNFSVFTSPDLYGIPGILFRGITHEIDVDTPTGTFTPPERITWSGGAGQILAINSTTAATKVWIQLLSGTVPADNDVMTGASSSATVSAELTGGSITPRAISTPFVGQSTGSAIIGAYGLGIQTDDLTSSDTLFDLTNTQRLPPNNVTFTVFGLESGEDRVLVTNDQATGIDFDQLTLNTSLTGDTESAAVMTASIPTDTPSSGTIRIQMDDGRYRLVNYSSYSSATFTFTATEDFNPDSATAPKNVFISYIDKLAGAASESFTVVYLADRTMFVRVRDGGVTPIKTFETTGTLGSSGGSSTAIRTTDE